MRLRSALLYMLTGRALSLVVMAGGFAALGRLLAPEAFGHFAVALAVYGMAEVISQFGLRQLVISRKDVHSRDEIAAAAGLSLLISAALCGCGLAAAATLSGGLLPQPLAAALVPLSLTLLIGPFTLSTEALLHRSLRFGLVSVSGVAGVILDVAVSVTLALAGFGAAALAWGVLASHLAVAAVLMIGGGAERRILPRVGAWRGLMGWGERLTLIQILPRVSELLVLSALSGLQGAAGLGVFNRARTIHRLLDRTLLEGIKPVVLPAFSAALRDGTDPARLYRIKLDCMAAICWPGFALIALLAAPLVALLLGPGWIEAVAVVQILALMGLGLPITKMSQKFFVAIDETALFLRIELVREAVIIPLAVLGALVSLQAFALAYVVGNLVKAAGVARGVHDRIGGPEGGYRPVAWRAALLTLATLAGPAFLTGAALSPAGHVALALPLAGAGWLAGLKLTRHPLLAWVEAGLRHAWQSLRQLSGRR